MSDHDPLCPWLNAPDADTVSPTDCRCFLIHAARADEREKANGNEAYNAGYHDGASDERERIAAAVKTIPSWEDREGWLVLSYKDVLAVLSGGRDE